MSRPVVLAVVGFLAALVIVTTATAMQRRTTNIEPRDRVNGMLVVQGTSYRADGALFGSRCAPNILKAGRYTRTCSEVPRGTRLFVGYGMWAPKATIERVWNPSEWSMWIDGQRVSLAEFGTTDRTLSRYPPAGGKDVTLREWRVILVRPTPGRHTIRYRFGSSAQKPIDATWTFSVSED